MPELTERKRLINMHMSISMGLMEVVKARQLDTFFSMEESISKQVRFIIWSNNQFIALDQEYSA